MHSRVLPGGKILHLCTNYKIQNNFLEHKCWYSAYFKFLCFLQGSNIPNRTSWRAVPRFQPRDTVLMHVHILNVRIFRSQDTDFPRSHHRGRAPMPHLHAQPLPTFHMLNRWAYRTGFSSCYTHRALIPAPQKIKFSGGLQGRGKAARKGVCIKTTH